MQVLDWLEGMGLSQYADAFAAEGVDLSIVNSLSDQDLKDIGVAMLGHRRKIMAAAAQVKSREPLVVALISPAANPP